jgi:hypothetical protein
LRELRSSATLIYRLNDTKCSRAPIDADLLFALPAAGL